MGKETFCGRVFNSNESLVKFINLNKIIQTQIVSINTPLRKSWGENVTDFVNHYIVHFYHNQKLEYDLFEHLDQEKQILVEDVVHKFRNEKYRNFEDLLFPVNDTIDPRKKVEYFETIKKLNEGTWWISEKK